MNTRPDPDEHHPYYGSYISLVPDGDVIETLEWQLELTSALLGSVAADRETYRYAPGKWTIRDVVGHLLDTERVFGLRALHIARRDPSPLPSFEQDDWVRAASASTRNLALRVAEWRVVRRSHVFMFRSFSEADWARRGLASSREFSVRAIPWILAGHELHHRQILVERYGLEEEIEM